MTCFGYGLLVPATPDESSWVQGSLFWLSLEADLA